MKQPRYKWKEYSVSVPIELTKSELKDLKADGKGASDRILRARNKTFFKRLRKRNLK